VSARSGCSTGGCRNFAWQPSGRRGITRLNCVDLFYWLQRATPVIASTGPTTTGAAIGKILDAIGATDIGMRDLGNGDNLTDFSANGVGAIATGNGLELIQGLLESERGVFFIAGTGKATYRSRIDRLTRTSAHTFADTFTGAEPGVDWNQAFTRVTVQQLDPVTRAVLYTAQAISSTGIAKQGFNDLPTISTPYLTTNAQTDALATWVLSQNVSAKPPTRDFTIDNRTSDLLTQALTRELVDRITATESRGGSSGDYHIDSLSQVIDAKGGLTATYLLSKASTLQAAVFDSGLFDTAQFVL